MPQLGAMPGETPGQADQMGQEEQADLGAQVPVKMPTVQLGELADIKVVSEAQSISRTNGEDSIGVQIVKAADSNTVDVVNGVKDTMNQFERN